MLIAQWKASERVASRSEPLQRYASRGPSAFERTTEQRTTPLRTVTPTVCTENEGSGPLQSVRLVCLPLALILPLRSFTNLRRLLNYLRPYMLRLAMQDLGQPAGLLSPSIGIRYVDEGHGLPRCNATVRVSQASDRLWRLLDTRAPKFH